MMDPRKTFGAAVSALAEADDRIVIFSADSGKSSGFKEFAEKYPERYFECGIMEQCAVAMAAGMATIGKIPVFCAIAPFVTSRPFEMLRNDLGYMMQNVKIVGRNGGFTYSDLGSTHHSLEDFAITRMIPGMTLIAPQDPLEIKTAAKAMIEHTGPVYMRIGGPKEMVLFEEHEFKIGKASILREGDSIAVITTGAATKNVLMAANSLSSEGIRPLIIGMPTVWPIDEEMVRFAASRTKKLLVVEEHYDVGGLGTMVSELCCSEGLASVRRLGVPHSYVTTGDYDALVRLCGLDADGISAVIRELAAEK